MIIGPDFIWLHLPKCAGTSVEKAIAALYAGRPGYQFDEVGPAAPMIWHDTIDQRTKRNPSFSVGNRKIIACIRRLPAWILSRVHFESRRAPYHRATRDMIVEGRFYEQSGFVNHADYYISLYNSPDVDCWIRTEHLAEDLASALGISVETVSEHLSHENSSAHSDELMPEEIECLYDSCPKWAALEERVYGARLPQRPSEPQLELRQSVR